MRRTLLPSPSMTGSSRAPRCSKLAASSSFFSGSATQVWMPESLCGAARVLAPVRSEWVTPEPAIIQLTSPGRIVWSAPVESR